MENYWKKIDKNLMYDTLTEKGYGVSDISVGDKVWIADLDYLHHEVTEGLITKVTKTTVHVQKVADPTDVSIYYKRNYSISSPEYNKFVTFTIDCGYVKYPQSRRYVLFNKDRFEA